MTAGAYLACEVHGRLVRRDAWPYCEGPVLACVGFDGEAAGWCTAGPVPEVSWARLLSGEKYWPGVTVMSGDGQRLYLRPDRSEATAQVHRLVNEILRKGPCA